MPNPQLQFLTALLAGLRDRARAVRAEPNRSRGASVVEWIMIIAAVAGICLAVAAVLKATILSKANGISLG